MNENKRRKCKGITKAGKACRRPPGKSGFCLAHDPSEEAQDEVRRQRAAGGKAHLRQAKLVAQDFPPVEITHSDDVLAFMVTLLNDTRQGRVDLKTGHALTTMARVCLEAIRCPDEDSERLNPDEYIREEQAKALSAMDPEERTRVISALIMDEVRDREECATKTNLDM